jgi:ElaB/YqjD/DUF883 family membrane-anchored ribosome-binding protein
MTTSTSQRSKSGTGRLQEAASDVAEEAGRTAEVTASRSMDRAAEALEQLTQAFRGATSELRQQQPQLAGAVDSAAEQVDKAAGYLRQHEPREIVDNAQQFARQQPAIVIGGGLALGLILGRVLRSASTEQPGWNRSDAYGPGRYGVRGSYGGYQGGNGAGAGYGGTGVYGTTGRSIDDAAGGQGYGTAYGVRSDSAISGTAANIGPATTSDAAIDRGSDTDFSTTGTSESTTERG